MRGSQTIDKTNKFRQFDESFDQTFSKVCEVEGAEPSSPVATDEISQNGVSFCGELASLLFSLRLFLQRKSG